jgi:hypothetical protein
MPLLDIGLVDVVGLSLSSNSLLGMGGNRPGNNHENQSSETTEV